MSRRPLPPPPDAPPPVAGVAAPSPAPARGVRPLPSPPAARAAAPGMRFPRPQLRRWHGGALLAAVLGWAVWQWGPGLWLETVHRRPTPEWARSVGRERLAADLPNGQVLDVKIDTVEILRVEPGRADVSLSGAATLREPLYQRLDWRGASEAAGVDLRALSGAVQQAAALRWTAAPRPAAPDAPRLAFVKEMHPGGKSAPFQLRFQAERQGTRWQVRRVTQAATIPADAFAAGSSREALRAPPDALVLGSEESNRRVADLAGQVQAYLAAVEAERKAESANALPALPPAGRVASAGAGFTVPARTVSPDGRYGVLAPDWEQFNDDRTPQNQLVETSTGRALATLAAPSWVEDRTPGPNHRVRNHMSLEPQWSADGAVLAWVLGGKWFPDAFLLLKLEGGEVAWQRDVLRSAQNEILARARAAAPQRYAAAMARNRGSGSAFHDGFTVDLEIPRAGFTLPWRGRVTLTANPKELPDWPAEAEVQASLDMVVSPEGVIAFSGFRMPPGTGSEPSRGVPPVLPEPAPGARFSGALTRYANAKHSFSVVLPVELAGRLQESAAGDRATATSPDGRTKLLLLVKRNAGSVQSLYNEWTAEHTAKDPGKKVDFKVLRDGWFAVSGADGPRGYYVKVAMRGSTALFLCLEYDEATVPLSEEVLTKMSRSFPNGN